MSLTYLNDKVKRKKGDVIFRDEDHLFRVADRQEGWLILLETAVFYKFFDVRMLKRDLLYRHLFGSHKNYGGVVNFPLKREVRCRLRLYV